MHQNRPKLSLRHDGADPSPTTDATEVLRHALAHHLCVRATYNKVGFILAPHILYERHGEAHLDAVAIERAGAKPQEVKLGTFKLSGLRDLAMTSEPVTMIKGFHASDPRYGEQVIARLAS